MPGEALANVRTCDPRTGRSPVAIDATLCKACGICVGICPREVFASGPDGVPDVVQPDACTACRICELHCPDFTITVCVPPRGGAARAEVDAD